MTLQRSTVSVRLYVRRDLIERLMQGAPDQRCSLSTMVNAAIEAALSNPTDIAKNAQDVSYTCQVTRN